MNGAVTMLMGRRPRRTLIRVVLLVVVSAVVFTYVLRPIRVTGLSMVPTFMDGHLSFVNLLSYHWSKPQRGDIVVVRVDFEDDPSVHEFWLKRIIALPGETMTDEDGTFYINGRPLDEPYVKLKMPWNYRPVTLGEDEYFVVGDNRGMQQRQHSKGIFRSKNILGKVLF